MSGEDDDEGKEEYLGIVDRVVDVRPVRGAAKYQEEVKTGKRFLVFLSVIRQKQPEPPKSQLFLHGSVDICDIHRA